MGFFDKFISLFKKKNNEEIEPKDGSVSDVVEPTQAPVDNINYCCPVKL